jgi:hypothetical protein
MVRRTALALLATAAVVAAGVALAGPSAKPGPNRAGAAPGTPAARPAPAATRHRFPSLDQLMRGMPPLILPGTRHPGPPRTLRLPLPAPRLAPSPNAPNGYACAVGVPACPATPCILPATASATPTATATLAPAPATATATLGPATTGAILRLAPTPSPRSPICQARSQPLPGPVPITVTPPASP